MDLDLYLELDLNQWALVLDPQMLAFQPWVG
jgi:hypothetical protein